MRLSLLFPSLFLMSGCSEYKLGELDDKPDDDTGTVLDTVPTEECNVLPTSARISSPGLGWENDAVCAPYSTGTPVGVVGVRTLTSILIEGTETSPTPPEYVRVVAQVRDGSGDFDYPDEDNLRSDNDVEATEVGSDWEVDSAALSTLNSCSFDCDWEEVVVEIQDDEREQSYECEDYVPEVLLCLNWTEVSAMRSEPVEASCAAGSGMFQLVPRRLINKDGDSSFSLILTPIQLTGTGRLTGAAWITELNFVEDQGQAFRILKPNATFGFDSSDLLVNKQLVSYALYDENDWSQGVVSGGAPIVAEEIADTVDADFRAAITWSCGTVPVQGQRHPTRGYVLDPVALECSGSWKQKFTVRPIPYDAPSYLHLERYGHVEDREVLRLGQGENGYPFQIRRGDVIVRGRLASYNENGATLVLSKFSVASTEVCEPGTYNLPIEQ